MTCGVVTYGAVCLLQNASADVEKMILGNKCDLQESRVVDQERGRVVSRVM